MQCDSWQQYDRSVQQGAPVWSLLPAEARQLLGPPASECTRSSTAEEPLELVWAQEQVPASSSADPLLFSPGQFYPSDLLSLQFVPFAAESAAGKQARRGAPPSTEVRPREAVASFAQTLSPLIKARDTQGLRSVLSESCNLTANEWKSCFQQEAFKSLTTEEFVMLLEICDEASPFNGSELSSHLLAEQVPRAIQQVAGIQDQQWAWLHRLIQLVVSKSRLAELPPPAFRKELAAIGLRQAGPCGGHAEIAAASAYYQQRGMPPC